MGRKFLIGQLACFGDCLYATTIAKQIKQDFPESHITWAVGSRYKSILNLNPYVDEVWEISTENDDYYNIGWKKFEDEALKRQSSGEFDEVIFSQIPPRNWAKYNGTIRGTILSAYKRPISVSVEPTVRLSETEIKNVKTFAEKHKLENFENVILFECEPGSKQSNINVEFALQVVKRIVESNRKVCFILSSSQKINSDNPQIIDASELTFRENAELTKYCTLLVGCSSGITWISTSDWAKKLPTIQLLNAYSSFAGMHFDFQVNRLDNSHIIEMIRFDTNRVADCILSVFKDGFAATKLNFHQVYKPNFFNLKSMVTGLIAEKKSVGEIQDFIKNYVKKNEEAGNKISPKYLDLMSYIYIYGIFYRNIQATETGVSFFLRKFIKSVLFKSDLPKT